MCHISLYSALYFVNKVRRFANVPGGLSVIQMESIQAERPPVDGAGLHSRGMLQLGSS